MHILVKLIIGCLALCVLYVLLFENYVFKTNKEGLDSISDEDLPNDKELLNDKDLSADLDITPTATPATAATAATPATPATATPTATPATAATPATTTPATAAPTSPATAAPTSPATAAPTSPAITESSNSGGTSLFSSTPDTSLPDAVPANSAPIPPMDITAQQFYVLKHALAMMKSVYTNPDTDKAFCVSVIDSIGISASEITDILGDTNINPSTKMDRIEKLVAQHEHTIGKVSNLDKLPPYINNCGTYTYSII